jgi:microcystin-dependent protein
MSLDVYDDEKVSLIEIMSDSGINLSSDDPRIKHTGDGCLTIQSTSVYEPALQMTAPGGFNMDMGGKIEIDTTDDGDGIYIGTNNTVPIFMGTTENLTTVNGDLTVEGNFIVNGDSVQHNITIFDSEDPLFYLNKSITIGATNIKDIGFIGERGNQQNIGWFWSESNKEFSAVGITTHGDDSNDIITPIDNYKPIHCGGLIVETDTSNGTATVCNVDINGQINLETVSTAANSVVISSAGGIDITATGSSKDIDITSTNGAVNVTATTSTAANAVVISSAGGIDITATGSSKDIDITSTNGAVNVTATTSTAANAVAISSAGGIDITATGSSKDIDITSTNGAVNVTVAASQNITLTTTGSGKVDVPGKLEAGTVFQDYQPSGAALLVPTGAVIPYAGSSAPGGWLLCNGQSLSTTTYSTLFAIIGYAYGGAGGSFTVPDLRSRFPLGAGAGAGLTTRALAATGGQESISQVPPHTHNITDPSHSHGYVHYDDEVGGGTHGTPTGDATGDLVNDTTGTSTTGVSINNTGTNIAAGNVDVMNPFLVLNYIIKV